MPPRGQVRAPSQACAGPQCVRAPPYVCTPWALLSPLRLIYVPWRLIHAPWRLIHAPWGSIMHLGAFLCTLGVKYASPFKCAHPPPYVCAPWAILSPLRLIYVPWGLNYAPWGSSAYPLSSMRPPLCVYAPLMYVRPGFF
jgi:hypothetical protein